MDFFDKDYISPKIKLKAIPKITYLLCKSYTEKSLKLPIEIITYVDYAIELLRDCNSHYYLFELLTVKIDNANNFNLQLDDHYLKWHENLLWLYNSLNCFPSSEEIFVIDNLCIKNYSLAGDVIKSRRKMLQLSQEVLSSNICDTKTISRLENNRTTTHPKLIKTLLIKLKLVGELYSDRMTYHNYDVFKTSRQIEDFMNEFQFKEARRLFNLMREDVDYSISVNRQKMEFNQSVLDHAAGRITDAEVLKQLKNIFSVSVDYELLTTHKTAFISKIELAIIVYILNLLEKLNKVSEMMNLVQWLERYFADHDFYSRYHDSYLFTMISIQSIYGNLGDFEKSTRIIDDLTNCCVKVNDYSYLHYLIYSKAWDFRAEIEKTQPMTPAQKERYMQLVQTAYILCDIFKQTNYKNFLESKL